MGDLKNIIFDMGGVLIDIDYKRTETAFGKLGYEEFNKMYSQFTADELFAKLETGKISETEFYTTLCAPNKTLTHPQLEQAWNEMLLDWRKQSLVFLESLARRYPLYLLSNTNEIHLRAVNETLYKQTGRVSIDGLFTKAYYSHKINLRKPDADIFLFVAKDAGIIPTETLFIDDSENNTEAAAALGFKTHLLLPGEKIEELDYSVF